MHKRYITQKGTRGFTLIELVVVIVVIGILAAITTILYTGASDKAHVQSMQSDLFKVGTQIERYKSLNGSYPPDTSQLTLPASDDITFSYVSGTSTYCLEADGYDTDYYISDTATNPTLGHC